MTGLRLVLISIFISTVSFAQTGFDMPDTPHLNCTLGGMDFNLNSTKKECRPGFIQCSTNDICPEGFHSTCPEGFHCETMLTCPTGYHTIVNGVCMPN